MSFKNKVVIITGASAGIGASIAVAFSKEGANVVLVARTESKLKSVEKECKKYGNETLVVVADVAETNSAKTIVDQTIKKFGKIDILINNAGVAIFSDITKPDAVDIFNKIIAVNLQSIVALTNQSVKHLAETKGNIINISSIAAMACLPNMWAYGTSKAAVNHLTKCLALDLASKGIRVNTINPGPVATDMLESAMEQTGTTTDFWLEKTALKRITEPEEIADLALFIASDKAKSITGSIHVCDVGCLLK